MSAAFVTFTAAAVAAAAATSQPAAPRGRPEDPKQAAAPSPFAYLLSFLLVGICWGFTTPFIRRAALSSSSSSNSSNNNNQSATPASDTQEDPAAAESSSSSSSSSPSSPRTPPLHRRLLALLQTILNILRKPSYAIPLILNLTGSVWFFILVGEAELSLTVPITNSLAFLFTVLGEYVAERKLITRDTWLGMACVCLGIAVCVWSKI